MSESKLKNLYECNFERDPKLKFLDDAFDNYYKNFVNLNDIESRALWFELRTYAKELGFTASQFQDAKLRASGRVRGDL